MRQGVTGEKKDTQKLQIRRLRGPWLKGGVRQRKLSADTRAAPSCDRPPREFHFSFFAKRKRARCESRKIVSRTGSCFTRWRVWEVSRCTAVMWSSITHVVETSNYNKIPQKTDMFGSRNLLINRSVLFLNSKEDSAKFVWDISGVFENKVTL